ncbi:Saccharopine dehydrogenase [Balamuthia mandrillaris]
MVVVELHVRAETKLNERRTPLTPLNAKKLLDSGLFRIFVERSPDRAFPDGDYEEAGCTLVEAGSWREAPLSRLIFGVKELPEGDDSPLPHRHIYFAHCFKNQTGWRDVLARFVKGSGLLLDLEFLVDDKGRRVAAFGRAAGLAGCAVGLLAWAHQQLHGEEPMKALQPASSIEALAETVGNALQAAEKVAGKRPRVMIMGAKGRCGGGAIYFLDQVKDYIGERVLWDMEETAAGGPFPQILQCDIFVNCIYLMGKIPPFLTMDLIQQEEEKGTRQLSVVVDVSCDYTNPNNPLPIYNDQTTLVEPILRVLPSKGASSSSSSSPLLDVVAIDHLPTLVPRESSIHFSDDLLSSLLALPHWVEKGREAEDPMAAVWERAAELFEKKVAELSS